MMAAALALLGKVPGKFWAYGAIALGLVFLMHSCEEQGREAGRAEVRAQWEIALKSSLKAQAQAQNDLTISAQKGEQKRAEKVTIIKKIVADYSEQADNSSDEKAYASARAAVLKLRNASGLDSADCTANSA